MERPHRIFTTAADRFHFSNSMIYAFFIMLCSYVFWYLVQCCIYFSLISFINLCGYTVWFNESRIKMPFGILQGKVYLIHLIFSKFLSCLFFHSNFRLNFSKNKIKTPCGKIWLFLVNIDKLVSMFILENISFLHL